MRIDPSAIMSRIAGARRKGVPEVEPPATAGTDQITLSSQAADVRAAMEVLQATPAVREDRVAQLRQQLAEGTLELSGNALVEKLFASRPKPDQGQS
jgi:flagellar biosynthesis anti-sigma factor FlgM